MEKLHGGKTNPKGVKAQTKTKALSTALQEDCNFGNVSNSEIVEELCASTLVEETSVEVLTGSRDIHQERRNVLENELTFYTKCKSCYNIYCNVCDQEEHFDSPFHQRSLFSENTSQILLPTQFVNSDGRVITYKSRCMYALCGTNYVPFMFKNWDLSCSAWLEKDSRNYYRRAF
ncbi:hypothetical protein OUZ56_003679 [Daphnia magna]|uniref:Uncharacterized protein n=1 Tax=Daphnia magna TaxID=35525 RepID=A0ABR0A9E1_9CRUS|nr:hypothetical protein OUZ56_003679 [Daphnia magna]